MSFLGNGVITFFMRTPHCLFFLLLLTLGVCVAEAQTRNRKGDVKGNLRMQLITVPDEIAADFERLNPKALFYHPVETVGEKSPLVIFLHGSGGSRRPIEKFEWMGEVKEFISPGEGWPTVHILVPQSKGLWDPASLDKMLDYMVETNRDIDTKRIYCIGYSMGGKGTWEWAMASPERFAAIIPKAFIPDLSGIERMTELPIWAMVGTRDSKPRSEGIPAMERALKERGSTVVRTTVFEGANHASTAGEVKKLKGVYDWLFSHALPRP